MRVLVFGQAKSGTTAVMRSVSEALGGAEEVLEPDDLTAVDLSPDPLVVKKLFGPHARDEASVYSAFDVRLLLVRDPRDRFISSLLYDIHGRSAARDPETVRPFLSLLEQKEADPASVPLFELHHQYWQITGIDLFTNAARSSQRLRSFWKNQRAHWQLIRYEDFMAGDVEQVTQALGVAGLRHPEISGELSRVTRTRSHGDWRHWFTETDRLVWEPFASGSLADFGYQIDWELDPAPTIDSANASDYVRSLIESANQRPDQQSH